MLFQFIYFYRVGHGTSSFTQEPQVSVGNYLGKGKCVTVIDTPGISDANGKDYETAKEILDTVKNISSIDVFLLIFKGKTVQMFVNIFNKCQSLALFEQFKLNILNS